MTYTFEDYKKEVFERNPKTKELYEQYWLNYVIAERLKKAREQKGLSQLELAKLANTTQSVIARIEAGNQNLSITTLSKFLKILDLELKISEVKN
ncbi:MAG: helix-turn-helix transcriptional regulator [Candidatus Gracilibacteria bacterium]|nr:helix-turn-helix transcriptional regulator [Candidatus Gracilibacteria bacterium]